MNEALPPSPTTAQADSNLLVLIFSTNSPKILLRAITMDSLVLECSIVVLKLGVDHLKDSHRVASQTAQTVDPPSQ